MHAPADAHDHPLVPPEQDSKALAFPGRGKEPEKLLVRRARARMNRCQAMNEVCDRAWGANGHAFSSCAACRSIRLDNGGSDLLPFFVEMQFGGSTSLLSHQAFNYDKTRRVMRLDRARGFNRKRAKKAHSPSRTVSRFRPRAALIK
jgi:hypothetical protein